jgi:hypothetical protein
VDILVLTVPLGILVAACVGVLQLRDVKRASRAAAGGVYVQRYWQVEDDLRRTGADPRETHGDPRFLRLLDDEMAVASIGLLDLQQWATWHGVLDDDATRRQVVAALEAHDPTVLGFPRLRRCLEQRERDGARHDISRCAAAG